MNVPKLPKMKHIQGVENIEIKSKHIEGVENIEIKSHRNIFKVLVDGKDCHVKVLPLNFEQVFLLAIYAFLAKILLKILICIKVSPLT